MFWENYKKLCDSINKKPNPVAAELGFSSGNVTAWKNGRVPKWTSLKKIANYFNVDVSDLISAPDFVVKTADDTVVGIEAMSPQATEHINEIKIIGRDGSYEERALTDEQFELFKKMIAALPEATDL